jgi:hypothetical protein
VDLSDVDRRAQEVYARWLDRATRAGFALSAAAFIAYVLGWLPAYVPLAELPRLWQLPAQGFAAASGAPGGWGWVALLAYGDYLCIAAVALFATVSAACYARLLPLYLRAGAWLDASLAATQVLVLVLAASGLVAASG